jgi:hypothetical protein
MKPEACAHEEYEVMVVAKDHRYDICKCLNCGAVAHFVPFFMAENRYKKQHVD